MYRLPFVAIALFLVAGCASYGVVDNSPRVENSAAYSLRHWNTTHDPGQLSLLLAFSGGGSRAAALAYGVLQELRDTPIELAGGKQRMLDEVDRISSVSGGSFTAAYYGLYGDRIFEDFETEFLRRDVEAALIRRLFSPASWFNRSGRTELAVRYYDETLFGGATFSDLDLQAKDRPIIVINASDLGGGVRFSFLQEYFDLLCTDLSSYSVARAVAASSAVPVLFSPIVLRNYPGCAHKQPDWRENALARAKGDAELSMIVEGLASYADKENRRYVHLVDGGITDNLGLRALHEIIEVAGGPKRLRRETKQKPLSRVVLISVNASTDPIPEMELTNKLPSLRQTVSAVSDVQLHRYNAATLTLIDNNLQQWSRELSTPNQTVTPYFIPISLRDVLEPDRKRFFNQVPTNFRLSDEQVDRLILAGRNLLRDNPEFQRLLADLSAEGSS
jgi:NTE family protein